MNGLGRVGLWLLRGLGRLTHLLPPPEFDEPTRVEVDGYRRQVAVRWWRRDASPEGSAVAAAVDCGGWRDASLEGSAVAAAVRWWRRDTALAWTGVGVAAVDSGRRRTVTGSGETRVRIVGSCSR